MSRQFKSLGRTVKKEIVWLMKLTVGRKKPTTKRLEKFNVYISHRRRKSYQIAKLIFFLKMNAMINFFFPGLKNCSRKYNPKIETIMSFVFIALNCTERNSTWTPPSLPKMCISFCVVKPAYIYRLNVVKLETQLL